jgi:predicted Ser/Thr protein kinase
MPSASPKQLGRYEVQAVLGKGSMGIVYLARDPLIGRLVALKTFRPNLGGEDEEMERFRSRFLREAQSAGILSHPNIVTIHDVVDVSAEGVTFIAMEYVQGTNLKEVLRYGKALQMPEIAEVASQVADALDYAHDRGVVHRDVKPANVLLTPRRQVKLTDFGIARFEASNLTHDGQLLGTPNYMSPEQVQGRTVDHRTDLFSFGVVVYEMITRHKPFAGDSLTAVTHKIVHEPPTPLERYVGGLPDGLRDVLHRALAKDPEERYQTAGGMARELTRVVAVYEEQVALSETQSIEAPPPGPDDTRPGTAAVSVKPAAVDGGAGTALPPGASPAAGGGRRAPAWLAGFRRWLRPQPGFGRPDWPRLAAAGMLVALLVAGLGAFLLSLVEPEPVDLARYDPQERREIEYLDLLREGLRANQAGDPMAAAVAFRRAEILKPDEPRVQRLRRVAEHRSRMMEMNELREQQLALQTAAAEAALDGGRWQEALSTATVVLGVDPENETAQQVARRARSALHRDQQRREEAARQAEQEAEAAAAEEETVADAGEAAEPVGDSTLGIELLTEGEGRLVVRVDGVLMADVGYEHFERSGLFRRKKPYRGKTLIPNFEIEPGARQIHYELRPAEGPPQTGTLEAEFPAGDRRTLKLTYVPGSTLAAHVE